MTITPCDSPSSGKQPGRQRGETLPAADGVQTGDGSSADAVHGRGRAAGPRTSQDGAAAIYPGGPAAPPRTLLDVLDATAARHPHATALDDGQRVLDYTTLRAEVDRFGERLVRAGIGAGHRVGIRLPSGTADLYLSILAVLSVGAAYVPVDLDDPEDRAELVFSEAGVSAVVDGGGIVRRSASAPPGGAGRRPGLDDDAWIIFTSGTTGVPKGVAVTHRSAAAFVDAEAALFLRDRPLGPGDRVLAGLSVAFDASCEEMWLAWRHGAALVPASRALVKTGPELTEWLVRREITAVSTVPTLAALWPVDALRTVRLLILGGEACPAGLADRLVGAGIEVWNTYGPTEATVVSCAAQLYPGEPVRIGLPLDGWRLAVVRPDGDEPVAWGEVGELVIGGTGLARYLDAGKDAEKFAALPRLGWDRAYRSGDLVRADRAGLVFVGRADTQVKIRGHRIELTEIESVLLRLPGVAQAVVSTHSPQPDLVELVAYYRPVPGASGADRSELYEQLRRRLPGHMMPAYLERLAVIPLSSSGKADRRALPPPSGPRAAGESRPYRAPGSATERALAEVLASVLRVDRVSVDSHFFQELGANSLLVAHFCAAVRERTDLPRVSTKDVYLHPTVRDLAAAAQTPITRPALTAVTGAPPRPPHVSTARYLGCGALQLLIALVTVYAQVRVVSAGLAWVTAARGLTDLYLRSLVLADGGLLLLCGLPIAAKWLLVGRWTRRQIPIWGLAYVRFWFVKTLVRTNPLVVFVGTPIYTWYLRALGAKIGRRVVILSHHVPVCTDLLAIGDDTVIRKDSFFAGYRAHAGQIETGAVTIGAHAFVGERTVLDIDTEIGDNAQLGHASSLYAGQRVPAGKHWHGSPAVPTGVNYLRVRPMPGGRARMLRHSGLRLLALLGVYLPVITAFGDKMQSWITSPADGLPRGLAAFTSDKMYGDASLVSTVVFIGGIVAGLILLVTLPRLLNLLLTPGRTYPLYGPHDMIHRTIRRLTNATFYQSLLGDSSYVVVYLRALGYRIGRRQTGSNFGASIAHESPFLTTIGSGTQISDDVSFLNAEYSSTSFRLTPTAVGKESFFGNSIAFPAGARVGEDCLIATKAMVPLDGPVHTGVGLLGSPSFEIPRTVERDRRFDDLKSGAEFERRLRAKNKHNIGTMALFLLVRWVPLLAATAFLMSAWELSGNDDGVATAAFTIVAVLAGWTFLFLVERATTGFRSQRPQTCSIYDRYFWRHERYWKLMAPFIAAFDGTPAKGLVWRLLGAHVGKRLYDDGCDITERTLVTIGDDCTLNAGSVIQCHSMEDGTFKSDYSAVGDQVTLGVGAFIHYGVTLGDQTVVEPDSFVMKGERTPKGAHWGGNPAADLSNTIGQSQVTPQPELLAA
jgi:non-ribosomal peptide synthetase-like protein